MFSSNRTAVVMLVLVGLMAATRMHHFGDATHLPDASLAVFLLAGLLVTQPWFFAALLLEAGLLDYLATAQLAVSDWCITPAYAFLIPTYGVLWLAGAYLRGWQNNWASLLRFSGVSLAAISVAFVISNASFYAFSGRYEGMSLMHYAQEVMAYYPQYLAGGVMYLVVAVLMYAVYRVLQQARASQLP